MDNIVMQEKLKRKRDLIKNNPEYYWSGAPSGKKDYINYKRFLESL